MHLMLSFILLLLSFLLMPYPSQAQQSPTLILPNTITSFNFDSTSTFPMSLSLPTIPSDAPITISVAICDIAQPIPSFFVSNDSIASSAGGGGTQQIILHEGVGVWSGRISNGATLIVHLDNGAARVNEGERSFEVGVSSEAPLHRNLSAIPLLGDTTATQALLFSPPFAPPSHAPPMYPNYTLPAGNLSQADPPPPSMRTNASLILLPTAKLQQANFGLFKSACAISNVASGIAGSWNGTNGTSGVNVSTSLILRDAEGWRSQWIVEGLTANTNYSAWVVQSGGAVGGPIYAFTKSSSFPCPLVHSLPYCPLISYAVPLPPTPDGTTSYTDSNLPSNITEPLISSLSNFTTALLTFPCGRDVFSPLQTCESCAIAYRAWACAVSLPRCGEIPPPLASSLASQATATREVRKDDPLPTPALLSHPPAPARLADISAYNELLPCIETCHAVDRACPPLIGWTCPQVAVNANWSYGVGFIDSWEGEQGEGVPGVAQDRWGVAWCNG